MRKLFGPWLALLLFVLASVVPRPAVAHDPFEITTTGRIRLDRFELVSTMTRGSALALLDPTRQQGTAFAPEEFASLRPKLLEAGRGLFQITSAAGPLEPRQVEVALTVENEVEFRWELPLPPPGKLQLRALHLTRLPTGYATALTLTQDAPPGVLGFVVLTADAPELTATVQPTTAAGALSATSAPTEPSAGPVLSLRALFVLGVEHILTGYDHLLFLGALLLACRRARAMLGVVTCFTLAHSITLALAATGQVSAPSAWVEPLIAASIIFVAVENLLQRRDEPRFRWAVTFGFGLIHGFGFASVLRELGLGASGSSIVLPLLSFNLGVEAGQLGVACLVLPLLLLLRRRAGFTRWVVPIASLAIALAGGYWLLERTLLA